MASATGRGWERARSWVRPAIVAERSRIGDWEVAPGLVRPGGPVLVTMVECKSRCTRIAVVENKDSTAVTDGWLRSLRPYRDRVETMTFDHGKEFARHAQLAEQLQAKAYFEHPCHSWERALNEHTNGLILNISPRAATFSKFTGKAVQRVEAILNSHPRKCLTYRPPNDSLLPPRPLALVT